MVDVVRGEEYVLSVNMVEDRLILHYDGISSPAVLLSTNSTLSRHKRQITRSGKSKIIDNCIVVNCFCCRPTMLYKWNNLYEGDTEALP